MKAAFFALVFLSLADIALAADVIATVAPVEAAPSMFAGILAMIMNPAMMAKIVAMMVGLQLILRGTAEGLTKISVYTDNNWDNKISGMLSEAAWLLGSILGKFGYSEPSEVSKYKVELAQEKSVAQAPQK